MAEESLKLKNGSLSALRTEKDGEGDVTMKRNYCIDTGMGRLALRWKLSPYLCTSQADEIAQARASQEQETANITNIEAGKDGREANGDGMMVEKIQKKGMGCSEMPLQSLCWLLTEQL